MNLSSSWNTLSLGKPLPKITVLDLVKAFMSGLMGAMVMLSVVCVMMCLCFCTVLVLKHYQLDLKMYDQGNQKLINNGMAGNDTPLPYSPNAFQKHELTDSQERE